MKIQFVSMGKPTEYYDSFEEVPYQIVGFKENLSELRAEGACVHNELLDDIPQYKGWAGPMLDGGMYRYESWEVYDMLSR